MKPVLPVLLLALATAGCPRSQHHDAGPDVGLHDVTGTNVGDVPEASRWLVRRALYSTALDNLLVDPFVTGDLSAGHFVTYYPSVSGRSPAAAELRRRILGDSPTGVSAPVVVLAHLTAPSDNHSNQAFLACTFLGTTRAVNASILVAVANVNDLPAPFSEHAMGVEALVVANAGLPGDLRNPEPMEYPLMHSPAGDVTIHGVTWARLALAAPVPVPQGGFFLVRVLEPDLAWRFAAPEVAPDHGRRLVTAPTGRPLSEIRRQATRDYLEITRPHILCGH